MRTRGILLVVALAMSAGCSNNAATDAEEAVSDVLDSVATEEVTGAIESFETCNKVNPGSASCYPEAEVSSDYTNQNLPGIYWPGKNLSDLDMWNINLAGANLTGANLSGADISNSVLTNINLSGAKLEDTHLAGANLTGANLTGANLLEADLSNANLTNANLTNAKLTDAQLRLAILTGANLGNTDLIDAGFWGANLTGANLQGSNWKKAMFIDKAILTNAIMPDGSRHP
jgi:uncharacterized protein YjbI with pentapeptide repeats